MRWVCPQCRRAISFAFRECPFCQAAENEATVAEATRRAAGSDIAAHGVVVRKLVPGPHLPPTAVSREPSLALTEGPWARGFRYGIGFALAVALVLLLLLGFWLWLSG